MKHLQTIKETLEYVISVIGSADIPGANASLQHARNEAKQALAVLDELEVEEEMEDKHSELKSCPFCGGKAGLWEGDWMSTNHGVVCAECETRVDPCYTSEERAIKAWNTRATTKREQELQEQNKKLVEALECIASVTGSEEQGDRFWLERCVVEAQAILQEIG